MSAWGRRAPSARSPEHGPKGNASNRAAAPFFLTFKEIFSSPAVLFFCSTTAKRSRRLYDRRPNGTVRGYAHHTRLEGEELYRWGGKADVTADVNFTDVAAWAAEAGFDVSPLETQGAFLARHVRDAAARAVREPALAFLLDPRGAGSGFKALELRKV